MEIFVLDGAQHTWKFQCFVDMTANYSFHAPNLTSVLEPNATYSYGIFSSTAGCYYYDDVTTSMSSEGCTVSVSHYPTARKAKSELAFLNMFLRVPYFHFWVLLTSKAWFFVLLR